MTTRDNLVLIDDVLWVLDGCLTTERDGERRQGCFLLYLFFVSHLYTQGGVAMGDLQHYYTSLLTRVP